MQLTDVKFTPIVRAPSLEELQAFIATAQTGSFTAAAQLLGRDPSAISRRISQIEQRLQVQLLIRTTRSVALTEAGTRFFRRTSAAIEEIEGAAREMSSLVTVPHGKLKISLPVAFGRHVIAPIIPEFLARFPEITVEAQYVDRVVDMIAEGYDAAIRVRVMEDSSLIARKIGSFRNLLVASPNYLERRGIPADPAALAAHSCLDFTSHLNWPDWILVRNGEQFDLRPRGPLISNNTEAILLAALADQGIALLAEWLVQPHLASGKLTRVLPDWESKGEVPAYLVLPPGGMLPAKTRAFIDFLGTRLPQRN